MRLVCLLCLCIVPCVHSGLDRSYDPSPLPPLSSSMGLGGLRHLTYAQASTHLDYIFDSLSGLIHRHLCTLCLDCGQESIIQSHRD